VPDTSAGRTMVVDAAALKASLGEMISAIERGEVEEILLVSGHTGRARCRLLAPDALLRVPQ
jgi:hypothetical protein